MLYALFNGNDLVAFTEETPFNGTPELKEIIRDGVKTAFSEIEAQMQVDVQ